jgi:D-alanyl-lipoteichoic acid acyltransferase DltB (MBOAT superfamily)
VDTVSLQYAALIAGGAVLFRLLRNTAASGIVLLLGGLAFFAAPLWTRPSDPLPQRLTPLACFAAVSILVQIGTHSKRAVGATVISLAILLAAAKAGAAPWFPAGDGATFFRIAIHAGLSYYVLRAIATVLDQSRGTVRDATTLQLAGYLAFAPILSLGPMERAAPFLQCWRRPAAWREFAKDALEGLCRAGEGLFKTMILADIARRYAEPFAAGGVARPDTDPGELVIAAFAYSLYIYINFSGACDVAVGAARLFGFRIGENFDIPYGRANISEFWRSWHISLSTWLRDFLFFPLGKRLPRAAAPFVAPLLVMSICGLWHGFTWPFLAWGALHGAALAIHQLWLRGRRGLERLDRMAASIPFRAAATALTGCFVTFAWIYFSAPTMRIANFHVRRLGLDTAENPSVFLWGAAVAAAWCVVPPIRDFLRRAASSKPTTILSWCASTWRVHAGILCILVVLARILLARTPPPGAFIYQNF